MQNVQTARMESLPKLPVILQEVQTLSPVSIGEAFSMDSSIKHIFSKLQSGALLSWEKSEKNQHTPLTVGVVLSGGQAAGGHNVICGLFDALKKLHPESRLIGFLDGPDGIIQNRSIELTHEKLASYRNQGGFDLIGAGRTKIETPEQFAAAEKTAKAHLLNGLVIIGGDDSNTNAALLAEHFLNQEIKTAVIGVPKTIDGDLKNEQIEISFGFDTACKTFSHTIGSLARDALSAKKYYFFVKLMGRSASHIALECALETHPNYTFIGEEVEANKKTLSELAQELSDLICRRADKGKNYGVILVPEGLIEFIPEVKLLIQELNALVCEKKLPNEERLSWILDRLTEASRACFQALPKEIQLQLLLDRDPHGNVQLSKIETERLLISMVEQELKKRKEAETYEGAFSAQPLFCGYEGRSCLPSSFDSHYCYGLGHVAALLIEAGATGYMASLKGLASPVESWQPCGVPLIALIHLEERKGKKKPVIEKALVDLSQKPFLYFQEERSRWAEDDAYLYPGPIQFFGPASLTDGVTQTLLLERGSGSVDLDKESLPEN